MKIGILTASRLALSSLQMLFQNQLSFCVAIPDKESEELHDVRDMCKMMRIQPSVLHGDNFDEDLQNWLDREEPEFIIILTFPYIVPGRFIEGNKGWFNFHFALLPEYRGPSPIFWVLKNGEDYGGITVHKLTSEIDAGPIVLIHKVAIENNDTFGMHLSKLGREAPMVLGQLINLWVNDNLNIKTAPQEETLSHYYPRPELKDLIIQWDKMTGPEISGLVRATNPWNKGAFTFWNSLPLRIAEVTLTTTKNNYLPGTISFLENQLMVSTSDNYFLIIDVVVNQEGIYSGHEFYATYKPQGKFTHVPG